MKRWHSVVAVVILSLALIHGAACKGGEETGVKEVKYGVALPLTGIYGAAGGVAAKHACELACEKIGEFTVAGETYRWRPIFEDNKWTGAGGVATATKFINEDGVKIMRQSGCDAAGAAQTVCEQSGVLMDAVTASIELFGPDKPYTFQTSPSYLVDTPVLFEYMTMTYPEVKTVAIALDDTAFGHSIGQAVIDAAPYFGLEVVAEEWIPSGTVERYPVATKLVDINPDLIICDVITFKPMREMGYEGRTAFIGWAESYGEHVGYENYQGAMIYQVNPHGADLPQEVRDFFVELEERYGDEPMHGPYNMATGLFVMTEVLKKAGTVDDVDRILETMHTETFDTWLGPMRFSGEELIGINNILLWPTAVHEIRDHEYVLVFEMSAAEAYKLAAEVYE